MFLSKTLVCPSLSGLNDLTGVIFPNSNVAAVLIENGFTKHFADILFVVWVCSPVVPQEKGNLL